MKSRTLGSICKSQSHRARKDAASALICDTHLPRIKRWQEHLPCDFSWWRRSGEHRHLAAKRSWVPVRSCVEFAWTCKWACAFTEAQTHFDIVTATRTRPPFKPPLILSDWKITCGVYLLYAEQPMLKTQRSAVVSRQSLTSRTSYFRFNFYDQTVWTIWAVMSSLFANPLFSMCAWTKVTKAVHWSMLLNCLKFALRLTTTMQNDSTTPLDLKVGGTGQNCHVEADQSVWVVQLQSLS